MMLERAYFLESWIKRTILMRAEARIFM